MAEQTLSLEVTRIHKIEGSGKMKAFVDLNVSGLLVVRGLKVVEGPDGLFVSMPQEQGKDKKWYDTIRCLSSSFRGDISDCVLNAYNKKTAE